MRGRVQEMTYSGTMRFFFFGTACGYDNFQDERKKRPQTFVPERDEHEVMISTRWPEANIVSRNKKKKVVVHREFRHQQKSQKDKPQCDVFWHHELVLQESAILWTSPLKFSLVDFPSSLTKPFSKKSRKSVNYYFAHSFERWCLVRSFRRIDFCLFAFHGVWYFEHFLYKF